MTSLTLATLLHVSVAAVGGHSYADAHRTTTKTGKPMVIMVSAEWCAACKTMEKNVFPQVQKRGLLKKVSFVIVNVDREKTLARKLIGNGPLPQLVMFRRGNKGWLRRKLIGGQSTQTVEKFIKQGLARDEATKAARAKEIAKPSSKPEHAKNEAADKAKAQPVSRRSDKPK